MRWLPRSSSVPPHRRWIADILHSGGTAHIVGADVAVNVAHIEAVRRSRPRPVSWVSISMRAAALAAAKWPELRTAYLPFPWPRLYVHPVSSVTVLVERNWNGTRAVFFDTAKGAEGASVGQIDQWLRWLRHERVERVGAFRRAIRIAKLPLLVRRLLWATVQWSGRMRAKYIGNIAISSVAPARFSVVQIASPVSFTVFLGPVSPDGTMKIQLFADHRLVDGLAASRILEDIGRIVNTVIVAELAAE
jgi:hypothetical protein